MLAKWAFSCRIWPTGVSWKPSRRSALSRWPNHDLHSHNGHERACVSQGRKLPRGSGNSRYVASVISLENAWSWSLLTCQLKMVELVLTGKKSQTNPQENSEPTADLNQNGMKWSNGRQCTGWVHTQMDRCADGIATLSSALVRPCARTVNHYQK